MAATEFENGEYGWAALHELDSTAELAYDIMGCMFGAAAINAVVTGLSGTVAVAGSVWQLNPFERGWKIEEMLGGMCNNFPVIDKFTNAANNIASSITSIKSMNINASTYQKAGAIYNKLMGYVGKLANFTNKSWGGTNVLTNSNTQRNLELAIPQGATPEQLKEIGKAVIDAAAKGVTITVTAIE
jgi:hypothetical protein